MYDVGGKLLSGIKSMYVNSLACVIVKGGENECFGIDMDVRQGCIMPRCFSNVYRRSDEGAENGDGEERSEIYGGGGEN